MRAGAGSRPDRRCPCGRGDGRVIRDTGGAYAQRYLILECPECGLRYPDRSPSEEELRSLYHGYGGTFLEPDRQEVDLARGRAQAARVLAKLSALRPPVATGRFLEIGCATGAFLAAVQAASRFEPHGVDLDATSAALAEQRLPGRIRVGSLAEAAYPDGWFAAVYAEQLIEHVDDTVGLLREIHRVLAPGGVVFLGTPNFEGLGARLLGTSWKVFEPGEHIRMFTARSMRHHLARAGFGDVRIVTGGFYIVPRGGARNLFPFRGDRVWVRAMAKAFGLLGLGDHLAAMARKG